MTDRPDYKNHPLWNDAMALTREAYELADGVRGQSPEVSKSLRKLAVSVPAHVASALGAAPERRAEHMIAARGALAELCREVEQMPGVGSQSLTRRAADLDRSVLFEFGATEAFS